MSGGHADHVSSVGPTGLVVVLALLVAAGWSSAPRRKAQEKGLNGATVLHILTSTGVKPLGCTDGGDSRAIHAFFRAEVFYPLFLLCAPGGVVHWIGRGRS